MRDKNIFSVLMLIFSTFLIWVISYSYHPIMVRFLTLKEFAEFESLISVINILAALVTSISLFFVKEFAINKNWNKSKALINIAFKRTSFLWWIIYLIYFLCSPLLWYFLHIDNIFLINIAGLVILVSFSWLYQNAFLQGKKHFTILAWINLLNPIFRILFWLILILFGFKLFWAVWWFIWAFILIFIIRLFVVKKITQKTINDIRLEQEIEKKVLKEILWQKTQILHFIFWSILLAIFINIDIMFAKHLFEDDIAGTYAGISIVAKFLIFIWMSIETVYYPVLSTERIINKKKIYILSILYVLMTIWALLFFFIFWEKILYLFKPWFEKYLDLLYLIIIYCGTLSLLNFIVKILIAFNKYLLNYVLIFCLIVTIILLNFFTKGSMYNLIIIFNSLICISLVSGLLYIRNIKDEK